VEHALADESLEREPINKKPDFITKWIGSLLVMLLLGLMIGGFQLLAEKLVDGSNPPFLLLLPLLLAPLFFIVFQKDPLLTGQWVKAAVGRGDYDEALRRATRLKALGFGSPWYSYEAILLLSGNFKDAERSLDLNLKRYGKSRYLAVLTYPLFYLSARICLRLKKYDKAIKILEKLETQKDRRYEFKRTLAEAYLESGINENKAHSLVERALKCYRTDLFARIVESHEHASLLGLYAWALAVAGQNELAQETIQKALQKAKPDFKPAYAMMHYYIGKTFQVLQATSNAKDHFRKALDSDTRGIPAHLVRAEI